MSGWEVQNRHSGLIWDPIHCVSAFLIPQQLGHSQLLTKGLNLRVLADGCLPNSSPLQQAPYLQFHHLKSISLSLMF